MSQWKQLLLKHLYSGYIVFQIIIYHENTQFRLDISREDKSRSDFQSSMEFMKITYIYILVESANFVPPKIHFRCCNIWSNI